jgi:hypothetical protein
MLGTMLADATVVSAAGDTVTLAAAGHGEGLAHKKDAIGKIIGEWMTGPIKVVLGDAGGGSHEGAATARPPDRLTAATANLERLKVLRAKDPTLGAAVDALDLELME